MNALVFLTLVLCSPAFIDVDFLCGKQHVGTLNAGVICREEFRKIRLARVAPLCGPYGVCAEVKDPCIVFPMCKNSCGPDANCTRKCVTGFQEMRMERIEELCGPSGICSGYGDPCGDTKICTPFCSPDSGLVLSNLDNVMEAIIWCGCFGLIFIVFYLWSTPGSVKKRSNIVLS